MTPAKCFFFFFGFVIVIVGTTIALWSQSIVLPTNLEQATIFAVTVWPTVVHLIDQHISLWIAIPFIYVPVVMLLLGIIISSLGSLLSYEEPVAKTVGTDHYNNFWDMYGKRLKAAYIGKFGYSNPEFDKFVDQRVYVMNNNGRGITRQIACNWLKRMAHMVEIK